MTGPSNQMVTKATSNAFYRGLRESGVSLLNEPVSWSLFWVQHPERPARRRGLV